MKFSNFAKKYRYIFIVLLGVAMVIGFQNCTQAKFQSVFPEGFSKGTGLYTTGVRLLTINGGATYTHELQVTLGIQSSNTNQMRISQDPNCQSGSWEAQVSKQLWTLKSENTKNTIFAKFKTAEGSETECIQASIIHDDQPPLLRFISQVSGPTKSAIANFLYEGQDSGSGIKGYECKMDSDEYQPCSNEFRKDLTGQKERVYHFYVRAIDAAGNISAGLESSWIYDITPPVLAWIQRPIGSITVPSVQAEWSSTDVGGSGVVQNICQLKNSSAAACTSPLTLSNLADDVYPLTVVAIDAAGNTSVPLQTSFVVDTSVPGDFQILGINGYQSGSSLALPTGSWLQSHAYRLLWSSSSQSQQYRVSFVPGWSINPIPAIESTVCNPISSTVAVTAFGPTPSVCQFVDGQKYTALVDAVASSGKTLRRTFQFQADYSAPIIQMTMLSQPRVDEDARIKFSISDSGQIDNVRCEHKFQSSLTTIDCSAGTNLIFAQPAGEHSLIVTATDKAGHVGSQSLTWKSEELVCDPFSITADRSCSGGITGELFHLTGTQQEQQNKYNSGDKTSQMIINTGTKVNVMLKFSQLFVPTRVFDTGFPTSDSSVLMDSENKKLIEYFAMRLKTVLKLPSSATASDEGYYQLALLSDDGATLTMKKSTASGVSDGTILINNEGAHPTKLGCATRAIQMTKAQRAEIEVKYHQAPRYHIAVTLLWRKLSGPNASLSYESCGISDNHAFFGPIESKPADLINYKFGQMMKDGWKVISADSFLQSQ